MSRSKEKVPCEIVFHPSWWNRRAGIVFDEDFFCDPRRRVEDERKIERVLYERFGRWGLGADRDRDLPQIGAVHNAAGYLLSEMLGCEVRYHANSAPDVVCARREDFALDVEAAFAGALTNCFAGCPHADSCIFAAQKMYVRDGYMGHHLDLVRGERKDVRIAKVKNSPYSRCVFACDNDVPDHYAATLEFEGGVTVAFSYEGLATRGERITRIMGSKGTIEGNGSEFRLTDLVTGRVSTWNMKVQEVVDRSHGHGGGDLRLFRDFLMAVDKHDEKLLTSSLAASVDSHVIGFACEKSRLEGIKVHL